MAKGRAHFKSVKMVPSHLLISKCNQSMGNSFCLHTSFPPWSLPLVLGSSSTAYFRLHVLRRLMAKTYLCTHSCNTDGWSCMKITTILFMQKPQLNSARFDCSLDSASSIYSAWEVGVERELKDHLVQPHAHYRLLLQQP